MQIRFPIVLIVYFVLFLLVSSQIIWLFARLSPAFIFLENENWRYAWIFWILLFPALLALPFIILVAHTLSWIMAISIAISFLLFTILLSRKFFLEPHMVTLQKEHRAPHKLFLLSLILGLSSLLFINPLGLPGIIVKDKQYSLVRSYYTFNYVKEAVKRKLNLPSGFLPAKESPLNVTDTNSYHKIIYTSEDTTQKFQSGFADNDSVDCLSLVKNMQPSNVVDDKASITKNTALSKADSTNSTAIVEKSFYGIQLAAGKNLLKTTDVWFKNIQDISVIHQNSRYFYITGRFKNKEDASILLEEIINLGFSDAFVVFVVGNRIEKV